MWLLPVSEIVMPATALDLKPAAAIPEPPLASLLHIPGTDGWPLVGKILQMLADPKGTAERFAEKYGLVYRSHVLGGRTITLARPNK